MMRSVQDILLQHEIPNKISKSYVHKRWSQECGEEAVFCLLYTSCYYGSEITFAQ